MKFLYGIVFSILVVCGLSAQTGPAGVGNSGSNRLWLRADTALVQSGGVVSQWNDISGNGLALSQATVPDRPTLVTGVMNGKPVIRFDGTSDYLSTSYNAQLNAVSHSVLIVARVTGGAGTSRYVLGSTDSAAGLGYGLRVNPSNNWEYRTGSFGGFDAYNAGASVLNQGEIFTGYALNFFRNGNFIASGSNFGQNSSKPFYLGRKDQLPDYFTGDIAEVIVYNFELSSSQRVLVENYLSSRYNITISNDRYDYEATHGNDVAGIANIGGSSNTYAYSHAFACSTFGVASNGSALYGHNGASFTGVDKANVPSGIARRLTRVWRIDTTNVGTLQTAFLFRTAGLSIGDSSKLRVLADDDGNFSNASILTGSYFSNELRTGLTTLPGTYFTLATTDESNFTPIVVSNTNGSGIGSLSNAVALANSNPGNDTIIFTIPPASVITVFSTISLTDAGTYINGDLDLDGRPDIIVNGSGITGGTTFQITGSNNTIRGLVIQGNVSGPGVSIIGGRNNRLLSNFIGTNSSGNSRVPNTIGVQLSGSANSNWIGDTTAIGRNVISGNDLYGIEIIGSDSNRIVNNYIGLRDGGSDSLGNLGVGVMVRMNSSHNLIGNGTAAGRNVISGNYDDGIRIRDVGSDSNDVLGNYLGTNAAGTAGLGNQNGEGCSFSDTANYNRLGDGTPGGRNVLSGNSQRGFVLTSVWNCSVRGNYVGLNAAGTDTIPNGLGALLDKATNNMIGGNGPSDANYIAGNSFAGIGLTASSGGRRNRIIGNRIGLGPGSIPFGNGSGSGVLIISNSSADSLRDNVIAYHKGFGISIDGASTDSNVFFRNSIFRNDSGAVKILNGAQQSVKPPKVTSVSMDSTVSGTAAPFALVQVYNDSTNQGRYYIDTVRANGSGNWSKKMNLLRGVNVTALQDSASNTSAFSIAVTGLPPLGFIQLSETAVNFGPVRIGDTVSTTVRVSGNTGPIQMTSLTTVNTVDFTVTASPALPQTIDPSIDTLFLTILFHPQSDSGRRDTVRFVSDAINQNADIVLNGFGLENIAPIITTGILRSTVLKRYSEIYFRSDEGLLTGWATATADTTDTLAINGIGGSARRLFVASYRFADTGVVSFHFEGTDSAGNTGISDRSYNVVALSNEPLVWTDGLLHIQTGDRRNRETGTVIIGHTEGEADVPSDWLRVSPVFSIDGNVSFDREPSWKIGVVLNKPTPDPERTGLYQNIDGEWKFIGRMEGSTVASGQLSRWGEVAAFYNPDFVELPKSVELAQNYPNPFNPTTTIRFGLPESGRIRLTVYNILGQRVAQLLDEIRPAGFHNVVWNGQNANGLRVSSGVYLYRLETDAGIQTRKMILLK